MKIRKTDSTDVLWPQIAALFPEAAAWLNDPSDDGEYYFLVATDDDGNLLGASVIEISDLVFGPLSDVPAGFLENIEVLEAQRRKGVGAALLQATLHVAWQSGCESVRGTVDYTNSAALALYRSQGLGFIPQEDPDAPGEPERTYAIVAINPDRVTKGYAANKSMDCTSQ